MSVFTSFAGNLNADIVMAATPGLNVISLPLAATEYAIVLPANCRQYMIKTRGGAKLQLAFTSGNSGTAYIEIPKYCFYSDSDIKLTTTVTLYVQSPLASQELEVLTWV